MASHGVSGLLQGLQGVFAAVGDDGSCTRESVARRAELAALYFRACCGCRDVSSQDIVRQLSRDGGLDRCVGGVVEGRVGVSGGVERGGGDVSDGGCDAGSLHDVGKQQDAGRDTVGQGVGVVAGFASGCRGPNWERNRAWKAEKKRKRDAKKKPTEVPAWRVDAKPLSPPSTVVTVDSRTVEEVEAARTLAVRRTFENRLAVARAKYQLSSFADKTKSEAIRRLEVARLEEKFNTTKAKSQASYKKCASPLDSVGSAGSAGEFAWKQEIRKRDAVQMKSDYFEKQLEKAMLYLSDEGKRAIAEIPEPYIPSDEDIAAEDADICPYLSYEEMEAEAEKFIGVGVRW